MDRVGAYLPVVVEDFRNVSAYGVLLRRGDLALSQRSSK